MRCTLATFLIGWPGRKSLSKQGPSPSEPLWWIVASPCGIGANHDRFPTAPRDSGGVVCVCVCGETGEKALKAQKINKNVSNKNKHALWTSIVTYNNRACNFHLLLHTQTIISDVRLMHLQNYSTSHNRLEIIASIASESTQNNAIKCMYNFTDALRGPTILQVFYNNSKENGLPRTFNYGLRNFGL